MSPAAPAAVLFDLDGTLVHSEPVNVESVVLAVRRWGGELDEEDRQFVVGHSWNEIHQRIAARHGLAVDMDTLIAAAVEEKRALVQEKGLPVLPGAVEAVRRLGSRSPAGGGLGRQPGRGAGGDRRAWACAATSRFCWAPRTTSAASRIPSPTAWPWSGWGWRRRRLCS